jgi:hypothetical protein
LALGWTVIRLEDTSVSALLDQGRIGRPIQMETGEDGHSLASLTRSDRRWYIHLVNWGQAAGARIELFPLCPGDGWRLLDGDGADEPVDLAAGDLRPGHTVLVHER